LFWNKPRTPNAFPYKMFHVYRTRPAMKYVLCAGNDSWTDSNPRGLTYSGRAFSLNNLTLQFGIFQRINNGIHPTR
jgi:hypothetical protein